MKRVWLEKFDPAGAYMDVQPFNIFWEKSKDIISRIKALGFFGAGGSVM